MGMRKTQEDIYDRYAQSGVTRAYVSNVVPGFFQTPAYATALIEAITDFQGTPNDVSEAVAARVAGSRFLYEGGHRFIVLMEEAKLRFSVRSLASPGRSRLSLGGSGGESRPYSPVAGWTSQPRGDDPVSVMIRPTAIGSPGYTETLPCEPETARRARWLVSAALNTWGIGELADAGTLIVSELVSNAIRRTSCRLVRVSVQRVTNDLVRIGVTDKSHALPKMDRVAGGDESGRGLVLGEALSHRWGYDEMRSGKTVWAELLVSAC